jgi:hypothetical protein
VQQIFLEHPAYGGIGKDAAVARWHHAGEEVHGLVRQRLQRSVEAAHQGVEGRRVYAKSGLIGRMSVDVPPFTASGPVAGATPPNTAAATTRSGISFAHASA